MAMRPLPQRGLRLSRLHSTLAAATLASLAACGGGGDSAPSSNGASSGTGGSGQTVTPATPTPTPTPTPAPNPVTLTGKVAVNQWVSGAVVCMDLNLNGNCDASEPISTPTGADGAYGLTYDATAIAADKVAAAPLLAQIPPSAIDAASPATPLTTTAYVLSAPAGKAAQINPLTTVVQSGMASGLNLADSQAAVALQLGVSEAEIYDYQDNAARTSAYLGNARDMASLVTSALAAGVKPSVVAVAAPLNQSRTYATLNYTDPQNYYTRLFTNTDIAGAGIRQVADERSGKTSGATTPTSAMYAAAYLTNTGWMVCDATGFTSTRGTPSRSAYCGGGLPSASYSQNEDISGKSMADIITAMQAAIDGSNSVNVAPALLGTATFPAGSILRKAKGFNVGQAIYINNVSTDLGVAGAVNLEGVIPNRLTVNVSNTNGSGMLSLGLGPTADSLLTVSFSREAPVVQYHQCIYDAVRNTNGGSCFALNKGEWNISTINGVRFMNFTNQPTTVSTHVRGLTEYKGQVATFRQNKGEAAFSNTASQRLNDVAGDAVRAVLGF